MSSGDVANLSLTPDFITSAGGPAAQNYLDGTTSRVHVSIDAFGEHPESDPLTAPALPLKIVTDETSLAFNTGTKTLVDSSLNVRCMKDLVSLVASV